MTGGTQRKLRLGWVLVLAVAGDGVLWRAVATDDLVTQALLAELAPA